MATRESDGVALDGLIAGGTAVADESESVGDEDTDYPNR